MEGVRKTEPGKTEPGKGQPAKAELVEAARAALRRLTTEIDGLDGRAAEHFGVNRTDLHCVDVISSRGPLTASQLSASTSLSSGGTTIALDRLERAGLVRRRPNPVDRRSVLVETTDEARRLGRLFFGPLAGHERELLERCSQGELRAIASFLDGLTRAIAEHRPPRS